MDSSSDNSHSSLNIFVGTYEYPEWFSKKKYFFYKKMLIRLQKLRYIHNRSSEYYTKLNYRIIGPSIIISALSGITAFLSTSDMMSDNTKTGFGISVGVFASVSTLLQSISGSCGFGNKSEAHSRAAEEYNKLLVKVKFEMEMPNEEDFTDKLESYILDIQNKCNFYPPQFIIDEWNKKKAKKPKKVLKRNILDNEELTQDNLIRNNLSQDNVTINIDRSNLPSALVPDNEDNTNYNDMNNDDNDNDNDDNDNGNIGDDENSMNNTGLDSIV